MTNHVASALRHLGTGLLLVTAFSLWSACSSAPPPSDEQQPQTTSVPAQTKPEPAVREERADSPTTAPAIVPVRGSSDETIRRLEGGLYPLQSIPHSGGESSEAPEKGEPKRRVT